MLNVEVRRKERTCEKGCCNKECVCQAGRAFTRCAFQIPDVLGVSESEILKQSVIKWNQGGAKRRSGDGIIIRVVQSWTHIRIRSSHSRIRSTLSNTEFESPLDLIQMIIRFITKQTVSHQVTSSPATSTSHALAVNDDELAFYSKIL